MNKFADFSEAMPIMVTSTATGSIISSLLLSNKTSDMKIAPWKGVFLFYYFLKFFLNNTFFFLSS